MRSRYWSCSKFADFLRGNPKISSGTSKEWRAWQEQCSKEHPIRYWIAEEGLDRLQNFVNSPRDALHSVRYYVANRWVAKTHTLTSTLGRGQWHEFDTRVLHCLFDELVNFVEIEQAWHHVMCDKEARKRHYPPWYKRGFLRFRTWRCPQAGIEYLNWAAGLKHNEEWCDKDSPNFGKPTPQAESAMETLALYNWWKNDRPNRPEPMDASGWSDICERRRQKYDDIMWEDETDDEKMSTRAALDKCHELEEAYDKEDEEMLIRLIKVRRALWT